MLAQDISGASVSGKFLQFTDETVDTNLTKLDAGVEVGLASAFAVGGNVALIGGDGVDSNITNFTAHGMYMFSPNSALGLFAAQDSDDDASATIYGIEFGTASDTTQFEAYYGAVSSDDFDDEGLTVAGFNVAFELAQGFSLGLDYESFTVQDAVVLTLGGPLEDLTLNDIALTASYQFTAGPSVFAELGQISASASSGGVSYVSVNEVEYVAVGVKYTFGRGTGNIFGNRTYFGFGS